MDQNGNGRSPNPGSPIPKALRDSQNGPSGNIKGGWLTKKGKKRWFLLYDGVLYWFNKEQIPLPPDFKKKANGSLQLGPSIKVVADKSEKKKLYGFTIMGSEKGQYTVYAKDEFDATDWIQSMQAVIDKTQSKDEVFEKQGYLTKKGKRRFFVLKTDHLVWFLTEKEAKHKGSFSLSGCTVELKNTQSCVFSITNGQQSYELTAKSPEYAQQWVRAIEQAVQKLQQTPLYKYNQQKEYFLRAEISEEIMKDVFAVVKSTQTAEEIKLMLINKLKDTGIQLDPQKHVFRIKNTSYHIVDETNALFKLTLFKACRKAFVRPKLVLVEKKADFNPQEIAANNEKILNLQNEFQQQKQIEFLVSDYLPNMLANKPDPANEVHSFRRAMARYRLERFEEFKDKLPEYLESEPLPKQLPQNVQVTVYLPGDLVKTLSIDLNWQVSELKAFIFDKYKKFDIEKTTGKTVDNYLLKVSGFRSYFITPHKRFIDYDPIRRSINKNEPISLSVIEIDKPLDSQQKDKPLMDLMLAAEEGWDMQETVNNMDFDAVPIQSSNTTFRVRVTSVRNISIEGISEGTNVQVHVLVELYHGGVPLDDPVATKILSYKHSIIPGNQENNQVTFNQWLSFNIPLGNVPKAARVCFSLFVQPDTEQAPRAIDWVNYQFVDHKSHFVTGVKTLKLWPGGKANPIGTCVDNLASKSPSILVIDFEKAKANTSLVFTDVAPATHNIFSEGAVDDQPSRLTRQVSGSIISSLEIFLKDQLRPLTPGEKRLLWEIREQIKDTSALLPKFLLSVDWSKPDHIAEAYRVMYKWTPPTAVEALELLDSQFADAKVREYAIGCLEKLNDGDLVDYLLQLVQVLKYEPLHDSALARFLLRRALQNKDIVGHTLFWHLRAEMHVPEIAERYGLLLEAYLRACGNIYRTELVKQLEIVDQLTEVALKIKQIPSKEERLETVRYLLKQVEFPERFQIPLFTNVELKGLIIEKCKVMTSKKLPLWLCFENADRNGSSCYVIFKCGDDLRQDVLTLQMIKIMDKLWTREGFQLGMSPYGVVSTGNQIGMVDVVTGAETTAAIARDAGGSHKVLVADTLSKWLRSHNSSDDEYRSAVERFALSCAGYCVATFVLGIGDRHNDNIMIKKKGNLFHIDFGHFLGHFKTKFGFEREKAPFVFTPQYAHILGSKGAPAYVLFEETCCVAYNIVRRNANLFINLFSMMLSTGLEELTSVENIMFLRDQLVLDKTDEQAVTHFKSKIDEAEKTKTQQFNDVVHILAN
mmetsp:Transcript_9981/g.13709  ORF Transcript_9981/g.13709 Transcript_9981/m.13709 type:complete len:1266 (+) Transcript_9981:125-3922(+)